MKKWIIILLIILLLVALLTICITGGFTKNILTGKIYHPQNVYEEIWNLVVAEEFRAEQTVLTTSTNYPSVGEVPTAIQSFHFYFHLAWMET